jgi:uncharacterized membrane protein YfcA
MNDLLVFGLAGFLAAFVDGALGMGFGPTSSTILLGSGMSPAITSTVVNLAKVASGAAGGIAHWRFRNIDHRLVVQLALPGVIGAVIGTTVLANVDGDEIRPFLAMLLLVVGVRILVRFSQRPRVGAPVGIDPVSPRFDDRGVGVVGAAGGVTNGLIGAWGPVVTPFLLHRGLAPRYAIGSVNTAEVAVAAAASASLLASLGGGGLDIGVVLAMLTGGVLAAPLAAYAIRYLPARGLGMAVAALLMVTNLRELAGWADIGGARWGLYALVPTLVGAAVLWPRWRDEPHPLSAS